MTAREALIAHLESRGMRRAGSSISDVYGDRWFRIKVGRFRAPVAPLWTLRRAILLHDTHHVVTGYDTDWRGEVAIAAWELASGGCARHLYMWLDRISTVLFGLIAAPVVTLRALRRGLGNRNLYGADVDSVLAMEVDELRKRVGA